MKYIKFETAQKNDRIVEIIFKSCKNPVICKLVDVDSFGQWWVLSTKNLPDRYVCIRNFKALMQFVSRYAFMNDDECISTKEGLFGIAKKGEFSSDIDSYKQVVESLKPKYKFGVPQRTANSGVCWYSAMCFAAFYCKEMRDLFAYYTKDEKFLNMIEYCLEDPKVAEELRHHIYYKYHVGDDPKGRPEDDGQNGLSEFCVLCTKLGVPIVRLFGEECVEMTMDMSDKKGTKLKAIQPDKHKPSLLFVRCFRTRFKPQIHVTHNGIRYRLISIMLGSEHCGHQIGASTCDSHICRWAVADADAIRKNIGPTFWKVKRSSSEPLDSFRDRWWEIMNKVLPIVVFNAKSMCPFFPKNQPTCEIDKIMKTCNKTEPGVLNPDYIYISVSN